MKILFVSDRFPFPPRDGVELPLAHISHEMARNGHTVCFGIITDNGIVQERDRIRLMTPPAFLAEVFIIPTELPSKFTRVLRELQLSKPFYYRDGFSRISPSLLEHSFDAIWASPDGALGFCEWWHRNMDNTTAVILGSNEALSTYLFDCIKNLLASRSFCNLLLPRIALRSCLIYLHEKRYFQKTDIIHVQTQHDRNQLLPRLPKSSQTKVIVAPNGYNQALLSTSYHGAKSEKVLLMASFNQMKGLEFKSFVLHVWNRVAAINHRAKLMVLGDPPREIMEWAHSIKRLTFLGFASDLGHVMETVAISVIPSHQRTGLINRLLDSLTAGLPVVTFSEPCHAIKGFENDIHGAIAEDEADMANHILKLLANPAKLSYMSSNCKPLAQKQNTWVNVAHTVESCIEPLILSNNSRQTS